MHQYWWLTTEGDPIQNSRKTTRETGFSETFAKPISNKGLTRRPTVTYTRIFARKSLLATRSTVERDYVATSAKVTSEKIPNHTLTETSAKRGLATTNFTVEEASSLSSTNKLAAVKEGPPGHLRKHCRKRRHHSFHENQCAYNSEPQRHSLRKEPLLQPPQNQLQREAQVKTVDNCFSSQPERKSLGKENLFQPQQQNPLGEEYVSQPQRKCLEKEFSSQLIRKLLGKEVIPQPQKNTLSEELSPKHLRKHSRKEFPSQPQQETLGKEKLSQPQRKSLGEEFSLLQQRKPLGEELSQPQQQNPQGNKISAQHQPKPMGKENLFQPQRQEPVDQESSRKSPFRDLPSAMFEGKPFQNLVIEVRPRGRYNSRRRVTVSSLPLDKDQASGNNNTGNNSGQYQQQSGEIQHSSSNPHIHGSKKDSSAKRDKNTSRHSYHPQQGTNSSGASSKNAANSNAASGKNTTNGSAASGRGFSTHNEGSGKRGGVTRERSFMRPHSQAFHTTINGPLQDQSGGGHTSRGTATVQRQRSCVANLYGSHGRSQSTVAMPAATAVPRPKPAMQLYRPPTALRVSDDYTMSNGSYVYDTCNGGSELSNGHGTNGHAGNGSIFKPGLNINAKEFVSLSTNGFAGNGAAVSFSGPNGMTAAALKHSKSSSQVGGPNRSLKGTWLSSSSKTGSIATPGKEGGRYSTGGGVAGAPGSSPPLRVHFIDDTITYDPDNKVGMIQRSPTTSNYLLTTSPAIIPIKRSKSLGSAADLALQSSPTGGMYSPTGDTGANAITDMAPFSDDVTKNLQQVLQSPDTASARVVMEAVRQLFNKLLQGTRYAEPAARYCIAAIEKESEGETFLETLLNTCQEYYQERERLLRPPSQTPSRSPSAPPAAHTRWVAYMTFLHEMYTQVKRRQRTVVSATAPGLLLLTLLAECCVVSLEDQAAGGASMAQQTECLFFILTGVGKDIETELPPHMSRVMGAARDALFASARVPAVRKTLLQLIEMNAASWQLPAPAVMYYYPGVGGK